MADALHWRGGQIVRRKQKSNRLLAPQLIDRCLWQRQLGHTTDLSTLHSLVESNVVKALLTTARLENEK
jgi:hypothetical protein